MSDTRLIFVGGFLGAGKTTLLTQAAARLAARGRKIGVVTNDQAEQLVDTGSLRGAGFSVREVAGGCFCCRFDELAAACDGLIADLQPDVLLAEPVGSCTDISATVLQPIKRFYAGRLRVAPFSVLVDPLRLREALEPAPAGSFPKSVFYIFRKQLEEADVILLNKADLLSEGELRDLKAAVAEHFPGTPLLVLSALRGEGVDAWLDVVLQEARAGERLATVDYDTYAEGEAVLGWLNATVELDAARPTGWPGFCRELLAAMQADLHARGAEIAHLKVLLTAPDGRVVGNLTSTRGEPSVRGIAEGMGKSLLIINARVHLAPEALRAVVAGALQTAATDDLRPWITSIESFSPARPRPVHRFAEVVA